MITSYAGSHDDDMADHRKKLIEVALPLDAINEASVREQSITCRRIRAHLHHCRHDHPP
jgi:hypothetical protein